MMVPATKVGKVPTKDARVGGYRQHEGQFWTLEADIASGHSHTGPSRLGTWDQRV